MCVNPSQLDAAQTELESYPMVCCMPEVEQCSIQIKQVQLQLDSGDLRWPARYLPGCSGRKAVGLTCWDSTMKGKSMPSVTLCDQHDRDMHACTAGTGHGHAMLSCSQQPQLLCLHSCSTHPQTTATLGGRRPHRRHSLQTDLDPESCNATESTGQPQQL